MTSHKSEDIILPVKTRILVLAIHYQRKDTTRAFLKSISQVNRANVDICVINNSSELDSLTDLNAEFPWALIWRAPKNLGYFGGADWGYGEYEKIHSAPDWTVICNTDLLIEDPTFFDTLAKIQGGTQLGAIAPRIVTMQNHRDQNPYLIQKPSRAKMLRLKALFSNRPAHWCYQFLSLVFNKLGTIFNKSSTQPSRLTADLTGNQKIYAPHGSCIILSARYFEKTSGFKHDVFLFGEEFTVAENCSQVQLIVEYVPRLKVVHAEHSVTGTIHSNQMRKFSYEALKMILSRYY